MLEITEENEVNTGCCVEKRLVRLDFTVENLKRVEIAHFC